MIKLHIFFVEKFLRGPNVAYQSIIDGYNLVAKQLRKKLKKLRVYNNSLTLRLFEFSSVKNLYS